MRHPEESNPPRATKQTGASSERNQSTHGCDKTQHSDVQAVRAPEESSRGMRASNPTSARVKPHHRLELALECARKGWAVFPLYHIEDGKCACRGAVADCRPGKHPRDPRGRAYKGATTDEATIRELWRKWPDSNIGIATGVRSSLVVLDVDSDDAQTLLNDALHALGLSLPKTLTVLSGRGRHFYFQLPSGLEARSRNPISPISLKGDGTYVVGAGSIHENGREYSWQGHPDDLVIAMAPDWLFEQDWYAAVKRFSQRARAVQKGNSSADMAIGVSSRGREKLSSGSNPTCEDRDGQRKDKERQCAPTGDWNSPETLVECLRLTAPEQTDEYSYTLVRGLKYDLMQSKEQTMYWMRKWHAQNLPFIEHESDWHLMEEKAERAWANAIHPLRGNAIQLAAERAKSLPYPPEAAQFDGSPNIQRTMALCAQLQANTPGHPFLLSSRQLAAVLGHNQQRVAYNTLQFLKKRGFLTCVHPGTEGKNGLAAKWLYNAHPNLKLPEAKQSEHQSSD